MPKFTPFLELLQIYFTLFLKIRLLFGLPSKKKQVQSQSIFTTTPSLRLRTERKWCVNSIRLRVPSLDTNFAKPLPRCTPRCVIACATSGWRRANVRGDGLRPPPLFHARLRIFLSAPMVPYKKIRHAFAYSGFALCVRKERLQRKENPTKKRKRKRFFDKKLLFLTKKC